MVGSYASPPKKESAEVVSQAETATNGLLPRRRSSTMESPHPFPRRFAPPYCFPAREDEDQVVEIPALTFDSIYKGHVSTSASPLFKMPVELFNQVLRHLSKHDLEALSLVDRDCCRLAALHTFRDLKIDLPLPNPTLPSAETNTVTLLPQITPSCLTACVRQLVLTKPSPWGRRTDSNPPNSDMVGYIPLPSPHSASLDQVITKSFPNLHIFNWDGPAFSASDIMRCVALSSLRNVRLRGTLLDPYSWEHEHNGTHSTIETLSLDVSWEPASRQPKSVLFFNGIFKLVQANLRQLIWNGRMTEDRIVMADIDAKSFQNLRSVALDSVASDSVDIIRVFVGKNRRIETLSLDTYTAATSDVFTTCGYIDSLAHFSLIGRQRDILPYQEVLHFLETNAQLQTVHLGVPFPQSIIDDDLLPSLQQNFTFLTSLQLTIDTPDISSRSLQAMSSLTALRRLWLSAGGRQDFRSTWKICHEDVVNFLKPLLDLELLAFSHDTYETKPVHVLAPRYGDYYVSKAFPVDVNIREYLDDGEFLVYEGRATSADFEVAVAQQRKMGDVAWERWHLQSMAAIANECYFRAFKSLEWCFVGQLGFSRVSCDDVGMRRMERDSNLTSLRRRMSVDVWRPV